MFPQNRRALAGHPVLEVGSRKCASWVLKELRTCLNAFPAERSQSVHSTKDRRKAGRARRRSGLLRRPPCSALDHTHAGWKRLSYGETVRLLLT